MEEEEGSAFEDRRNPLTLICKRVFVVADVEFDGFVVVLVVESAVVESAVVVVESPIDLFALRNGGTRGQKKKKKKKQKKEKWRMRHWR